MQEALLRGWRSRARCSSPGSPLPWLLAITRNEALRRARRTDELPISDAAERSDPNAADAFDRALTRIAVSSALSELTAEERRLVGYRYVGDLTQPAVADRLGLPEGTIKVKLHRARNRLRERFLSDEPN